MEFITIYRPYKVEDGYSGHGGFQTIPGGYLFEAGSPSGELTALLPTDDTTRMDAEDLQTTGATKLRLERPGKPSQVLEVRERE